MIVVLVKYKNFLQTFQAKNLKFAFVNHQSDSVIFVNGNDKKRRTHTNMFWFHNKIQQGLQTDGGDVRTYTSVCMYSMLLFQYINAGVGKTAETIQTKLDFEGI